MLNLTGTLFRSRPDERISTVRYRQLPNGQIETVADVSHPASDGVRDGELRPIVVLAYDADMTVQGLDLSKYDGESFRSLDLDDDESIGAERRGVLEALFANTDYVDAMLEETVRRLSGSADYLNGFPAKGMIFAQSVRHAEDTYARLVNLIGQSRAYISHGARTDGPAQMEAFRTSREQSILVVVQKGIEGFDAPEVTVITYLKTWTAGVTINQLAARAMRVTQHERDLDGGRGRIAQATILVPNDPAIVDAFGRVLAGPMDLAAVQEPCERCGELVCECLPVPFGDKECRDCGQPFRLCVCECSSCGKSRYHGCRCPRDRAMRAPDSMITSVELLGGVELADGSYNGERISLGLYDRCTTAAQRVGMHEADAIRSAYLITQAIQDDPFGVGTDVQKMIRGENQ